MKSNDDKDFSGKPKETGDAEVSDNLAVSKEEAQVSSKKRLATYFKEIDSEGEKKAKLENLCKLLVRTREERLEGDSFFYLVNWASAYPDPGLAKAMRRMGRRKERIKEDSFLRDIASALEGSDSCLAKVMRAEIMLAAYCAYPDISKKFDKTWTLTQIMAWGAILKSSGVRSLDLRNNGLGKLDSRRWQAFCSALALSGVSSLDLGCNNLIYLTATRWEALGLAVKSSGVRSLDLESNDLNSLDEWGWEDLGSALKESGVRWLGLGRNYLHYLNSSQWQDLFSAVKSSGVRSLDLWGNELYNLDEWDWEDLGSALKESEVRSLSLEHNDLYNLDAAKWEALGSALASSGVSSLNLQENGLEYDAPQWEAIKDALAKSGVTKCDVRANDLTETQSDALASILEKNYLNPYSDATSETRTPRSLLERCCFFVAHSENRVEAYQALQNDGAEELIEACESVRQETGLGLD